MNIEITAEYSHIFGVPIPMLSELLKDDVSFGDLITLSMLSWRQRDPRLAEWVIANANKKVFDDLYLRKMIFNKRPSSYITWINLLSATINPIKLDKFNINNHMEKIAKLLTLTNEKEKELEDNEGYLVNNLLYNYRDNPLYQFYRTYETIINCNELVKYKEKFHKIYGVDVSLYICICHIISTTYMRNENENRPLAWILDINSLARHTGFTLEDVKKVMEMISFKQEDCVTHATTKDEFNQLNFNFFRNTPFLKIDDDKFLPIEGKIVQELVFTNLYYRLMACTEDEMEFRREFGNVFESYITKLIHYACENSSTFNYHHINEFHYGHKKGNKSSDSYIYFHDHTINKDIVVVFEVKSATILDSVRRINDVNNPIIESIEKTITKPLRQQIKATQNIINRNEHKEINIDKFYYFVAVTQDGFPLPPNEHPKKIDLKRNPKLQVAGLHSIPLEAFEILINLISHNLPVPLSYLLEDHRNFHSNISFKTYLARTKKKYSFENKKLDDIVYTSQKVISNYTDRYQAIK